LKTSYETEIPDKLLRLLKYLVYIFCYQRALSNCFFTSSRCSQCCFKNCCGLEAPLVLGDQILKDVGFAKQR